MNENKKHNEGNKRWKKDEENYWWGLRKEKKIYDYKEERLGTKDIVESKKL